MIASLMPSIGMETFPNPALQNHLRLWYPIDLGEGEEELSFAEDRSQGLILNVVVSASSTK
jgi:hypothetical protein